MTMQGAADVLQVLLEGVQCSRNFAEATGACLRAVTVKEAVIRGSSFTHNMVGLWMACGWTAPHAVHCHCMCLLSFTCIALSRHLLMTRMSGWLSLGLRLFS